MGMLAHCACSSDEGCGEKEISVCVCVRVRACGDLCFSESEVLAVEAAVLWCGIEWMRMEFVLV